MSEKLSLQEMIPRWRRHCGGFKSGDSQNSFFLHLRMSCFVLLLFVTFVGGKVRFLELDRDMKIYANAPPGEFVSQVLMFDPDLPHQKVNVTYTMYAVADHRVDNGHFTVNESTGVITTRTQISRPPNATYHVIIIAYCNGESLVQRLTIRVVPFNKFPPKFSREQYSANVARSLGVNETVLQLNATDNDKWAPDFRYHVPQTDLPWEVTPEGQVRLTESLSTPLWAQQREFVFKVAVSDGGSPEMMDWSTVNITVKNLSAPLNIQTRETTETTAQVCWTPPPEASQAKGYVVRFRDVRSPSVTQELNMTGTHSPEQSAICLEIRHLKPWSEYQFEVHAWNYLELGMPSETGTFDTRPDYCANSECLHDSSCVSDLKAKLGYRCECRKGYFGALCERFDPCSNEPCKNFGTCTNLTDSTFACECLPGFSGETCSLFNPCASPSNPCKNGALCVSEKSNTYECQCREGYFGKTCERFDPCSVRPCLNNAACKNISDVDYLCGCLAGFRGRHCEINVDECLSSPCLNGGECIDGINAFTCQCPIGYTGRFCERDIDECESNPCTNGGQCEDLVGDFHCNCKAGYSGRSCEFDIDECLSNPCLNGASCVDRVNGYRCSCRIGYFGDHCQMREKCSGTIDSNGPWGTISWPDTPHGETTYVPCPLGSVPVQPNRSFRSRRATVDLSSKRQLRLSASDQITGHAARTCQLTDNGVAWTEIDGRACKSKAFIQAESSSKKLEEQIRLNQITTVEEFQEATDQVQQFAEFASQDEQIARNMIQTISHLMSTNESLFEASDPAGKRSAGLRDAIEILLEEAILGPGEAMQMSTENVIIKAKSLSWGEAKGEDGKGRTERRGGDSVKFEIKERGQRSVGGRKDTTDSEFDGSIQIVVPWQAISVANEELSEPARLQFISYKNTKLFRSPRRKSRVNETVDDPDDDLLVTRVLSASIRDILVRNLTDPVEYVIPVPESEKPKKDGQHKCVFWDEDLQEWSSDGVYLVEETPRFVRCRSSHLTSFSILFDPHPQIEPTGHEDYLSILSYIGAALSIIGLGLTILTFALFKSLNRDNSGKILINLCSSLLLMNLAFLVSALRGHFPSVPLCTTAAILIHYLVLTSLLWMAVEAMHMYQLLITVFASSETHFMLKRCLLAWGVPLLIVLGTASADLSHYDSFSSGFCIISPSRPLVYYMTYLAPAALILVVNCVIFIMLTRVLMHRRSVGQVTRGKNGKSLTVSQVRGAFTVMTLLGVTWVFGAMAIGPAKIVFQYIFCIANSLQGFIIFMVRCVYYPEARSCWLILFRTGRIKKYRGQTTFHSSNTKPSSLAHTHSHSHTSTTGTGGGPDVFSTPVPTRSFPPGFAPTATLDPGHNFWQKAAPNTISISAARDWRTSGSSFSQFSTSRPGMSLAGMARLEQQQREETVSERTFMKTFFAEAPPAPPPLEVSHASTRPLNESTMNALTHLYETLHQRDLGFYPRVEEIISTSSTNIVSNSSGSPSIDILRNMVEGEATDYEEEEKSTNSTRTGTGSTNRSASTNNSSAKSLKRLKHLQLLIPRIDVAELAERKLKEGEGTSWEYIGAAGAPDERDEGYNSPHGAVKPPTELPSTSRSGGTTGSRKKDRRFHTVTGGGGGEGIFSSSLKKDGSGLYSFEDEDFGSDDHLPVKSHTTKVKVPKKRGAILLNGQLVITSSNVPPESPTKNNVTQIQVGGAVVEKEELSEGFNITDSWERDDLGGSLSGSQGPSHSSSTLSSESFQDIREVKHPTSRAQPEEPPEIVQKVKITVGNNVGGGSSNEYFA